MAKAPTHRIERDSMGELQVPADALWGAQTQRAIDNFHISGQPMHAGLVRALALVKAAAAQSNADLGHLDARRATAIASAATRIAAGEYAEQFPVDRYQTGSGTSTNMNVNEVIAHLASTTRLQVHPNDHVNLGQSSNDTIPSAIRVATVLAVQNALLPDLGNLRRTIRARARRLRGVAKTGRTHLMDAMPITFGQEFQAWAAQLDSAEARLKDTLQRVRRLPIGGTAVGTGINADPRFGGKLARALSRQASTRFVQADNLFEGIAAQDDLVELSGQLNALAVALMKIANDLRWMNAGPLAGLGEIALPALQPGSSIMPGKVNPVIPEAAAMVCAQVMGLHAANTVAGQSGNFQLNVMLPLLGCNLLDACDLLCGAMQALDADAVGGLAVRKEVVGQALARNPILVTALNPVIGYEKAAEIAKRAYAEGRPVLDVALEDSGLGEAELQRLLDPARLTKGGIAGT
ncbi:MAG: class II fumarate hydratase [Pseudoxanthomonas suwonensis]|nr:class II fumarate hydratase [Pseudoxanthomonas suwonensis]